MAFVMRQFSARAVYTLSSRRNESVTTRDGAHATLVGGLVTVYAFVTQPWTDRHRFAAPSLRLRGRRYMVAKTCNRPVMEITMRARSSLSSIIAILAMI